MSAQIINFGCRLNIFEGEVIRGHTAGLENTVVINSCAVTAQAERDARQAVARVHKTQPAARIVVTGCAAQIAPERWAALPGVARVLGNAEKLQAAHWVDNAPGGVGDIMQVRGLAAHPVTEFAGRSRAFLAVQQGCDHRCTFCVIPFGRGANRSVPVAQVVQQCADLVAAGYAEIVLTGVDIASYGVDLPGRPGFSEMVRAVLRSVPELARLRCSSLDPAALDAGFFALLADQERLMPHLHLSVQAGCDMILKRMKRRHSKAQLVQVIEAARAARPGIAIGADLIAGFPTESDAMFEEGFDLISDLQIPYLHVFPYSERPGTPAARMPALPMAERRARAARLRALGRQQAAAFFASQTGQWRQVLTEIGGGGHTEHFAPVRLKTEMAPASLVRARIVAADEAGLLAEAA